MVLSLSLYTSPPLLGNMDGRFFLGVFLLKEFFIRSFRDMQMPRRRVSVSIGVPLGNLEGSSFTGTFKRKEVYLDSFLGPVSRKDFKSEGHGSHDPIWVTKGPSVNLLAPELFFFNFSTPCI